MPADLTITRASTGSVFALSFPARIHGPCYRCLSDAVIDLPISAREYQATNPGEAEELRTPYVSDKLKEAEGPFVAVTDYMAAVPYQIAKWVPGDYHVLGTDGFGFADTRPAARRFFQVDAESVVVATLRALAERGEVKPEVAAEAFAKYRIDDPTAVADVKQEGGDA